MACSVTNNNYTINTTKSAATDVNVIWLFEYQMFEEEKAN